MAKRKALGNAARFKVLQRDGFRCQYCGRTPPAVVLHVDHIVPVVDGGGNEDGNLIAACSDCNHGKFTKPISAETIPRDYKALAADTRERARQLKQYREHLLELRAQMDLSIDMVGEQFWGRGLTWNYQNGESERVKVDHLIRLLGLDEVLNAAKIAVSKIPNSTSQRFKYFCGVCWNRATALGLRASDAR